MTSIWAAPSVQATTVPSLRPSDTGTFLRHGSVVPVQASVLQFAPDGTATGLQSQAASDEVADELDALGTTWSPPAWSGPVSPHCGHRIPVTLKCGTKLTFLCTEAQGHAAGHEARGEDTEVLARMAKPSPRPRKRAAAAT